MSEPVSYFTHFALTRVVRRLCWMIGVSVMLTGCSLFQSNNSVPQDLTVEQRAAYLKRTDHWRMVGRIGIITPKESNTANIEWHRKGSESELRIYGFVGNTYALLTTTPTQSKISLSDDEVYYGTDPEQLLWQTTGWQIPVNALTQWILGLPDNAPSVSFDNTGLVNQLAFDDWLMNFQKYESFSGLTMPKKIKITHPDITLKFSVRTWEMNPDD